MVQAIRKNNMVAEDQLTLRLSHKNCWEQDDFFVSGCNQEAIGWIRRWPNWSLPGLVICGPKGAGKSHLGSVWEKLSGACALDSVCLFDGLDVVLENEAIRYCFVDDSEKADEKSLFHLFNCIVSRGGRLLLTCREAPSRWSMVLPDLTSRLKTLPVAEITRPDDFVLLGVLSKMFSDRQIRVAPEVLSYIVVRMPRSFEAAQKIVESLDNHSLSYQKPITIPFVKSVFKRGL